MNCGCESIILTCLRLGHLVVRLRLACVDDIRELDGILNEEDRNVVANNIPVALLSVELQGETTGVTNGVGTATATKYSRESLEDRGGTRRVCEDLRACVLLQALVHLEITECTRATGVDDTLWDTFVVEAMDLLTTHVIFQQLRAGVILGSDLEPVIRVGLLHAKVGSDPVLGCMVIDGVLLKVGSLLVAGGAIEAKLFQTV